MNDIISPQSQKLKKQGNEPKHSYYKNKKALVIVGAILLVVIIWCLVSIYEHNKQKNILSSEKSNLQLLDNISTPSPVPAQQQLQNLTKMQAMSVHPISQTEQLQQLDVLNKK